MVWKLAAAVIGGAAGLVCAVALSAGDAKEEAMDGNDPNRAMMEAYLAASRPGAMHRKLDALIGTWTTRTTAWTAPGAPPVETTGRVTKAWTLDGRFVQETLTGTGPDGRAYQGIGYLGFDNGTKRFQGVWMSDMTTAMITYSGTWDEERNALACTGTESNPMDGSVMKTRMETRIEGPDKHTLTYWYVMPDGREMRAFVIEHGREG